MMQRETAHILGWAFLIACSGWGAVAPASIQALMQLISPQGQQQQEESQPTTQVEVIRGRTKEVLTIPLKQ